MDRATKLFSAGCPQPTEWSASGARVERPIAHAAGGPSPGVNLLGFPCGEPGDCADSTMVHRGVHSRASDLHRSPHISQESPENKAFPSRSPACRQSTCGVRTCQI